MFEINDVVSMIDYAMDTSRKKTYFGRYFDELFTIIWWFGIYCIYVKK